MHKLKVFHHVRLIQCKDYFAGRIIYLHTYRIQSKRKIVITIKETWEAVTLS
ncbi:hypothetical protein D3C76_1759510 [compost metagenome]